MPLSIKITPYEQTLNVLLDETYSPKARNDRIAGYARQIIAKADEKNRQAFGEVPPKKITVNGRENAALTNIVPPDSGTIIDEYRLVEDVLAWIMMTLRQRSPVASGEYRNSHRLFADDVQVDANDPPPADRYAFFNTVPYARRLEVGRRRNGTPFLIQVPNRIYERTAEDAKDKFGNVAKISTGFASMPNSYRLRHDQLSRRFTRRGLRIDARQRLDRIAGSAITVPAIFVTIG
jgi:hypothetical protein